MEATPLVTIGLPVYNGVKFIQKAIDSLLSQTVSDFEIIISDNASNDGTKKIIETYAKTYKRISYVYNKKNFGAALNYNQLVNMARGTFFKWAAHDDVCAPTFIERCLEGLLTEKEAVLAYPRTEIIDQEGRSIKHLNEPLNVSESKPHQRFKQFLNYYASPNECNAVFGLMRIDVLRKTSLIGRFPSSDKVLLGELAIHGRYIQIPEYLFYRRDHTATSVRANPAWNQRLHWFDSNAKRVRRVIPVLKFFHEYLSSIWRVEMSNCEKVLCSLQLARWLGRNRLTLLRECKAAFS